MNDTKNQNSLDPEAIAAMIRSEEPSSDELLGAKTRVKETLDAAARAQGDVPGAISGCADFATLVPAYLAGSLSEPRRVLVEDHTRSCVACRRVVMAARSNQSPSKARVAARPQAAWIPFAIAASVVLALGTGAWAIRRATPVASVSTVESVEGTLISPSQNALLVKAGAQARGTLRTGRASRAVLTLSDGSHIEMAERSELSVASATSGLTVRLTRGRVLVQAAKQTGGRHLAIVTPDCAVSVVGTVFAVNHGMSGSRVSVLEGEVRVSSGSKTRSLHPGDQTTSRDDLGRVPIQEEVAFSAEHEHWQKLATELQDLRTDLAKAFPTPGLHHDTRLLDVAPSGTVVYGAVPNLSGGLREAWRALAARIDQGGAIATALGPMISSENGRAHLDQAVNLLSDVGERLGDEIALAVVSDASGKVLGPVVYAEARRAHELREFLPSIVTKINTEAGKNVIRLVDDVAALASAHDGATLLVTGDFVAVGFHGDELAAFASAVGGGATLAGSPLAVNVANAYRQGLHDVLAADLQRLIPAGASQADSPPFERLGLLDARGLLIARRVEGDTARTEASVTFGQTRRGVASWLAAPAPLGALDYVSAQATVVAAFAMKEPKAAIQELYTIFPELAGKADQVKSELGFSLDGDLAALLGGDFAIALDGPALPLPALKVIIEVYEPSRLQFAFERLVQKIDAEARAKGEAGFALEGTEIGGTTYHAVRRVGADAIIHFAYDNGYLVVGTDRAVVSRALQTRASGTGLRAAGGLADMLPKDGPLEVSALVYQNVGAALGMSTKPSLGWARGEETRIVMGAYGPAGLAGLDLPAILATLKNRSEKGSH
ncbi:MAG: FecR domain-containing protein [Thermoanaerobaculia bacterium]